MNVVGHEKDPAIVSYFDHCCNDAGECVKPDSFSYSLCSGYAQQMPLEIEAHKNKLSMTAQDKHVACL